MKITKKAILPLDFSAQGISAGIKKSAKLDLALFYSHLPAKAACQFTTNSIQAAPIQVNKDNLKRNNEYRAILANSGNANCFTGQAGLRDARETAKFLSGILRIKKEGILLASTGIIGRRMPVAKIKKAIPALVRGLSREGIDKAKTAVLTTDTFVKEITVRFNIGKETVTLCGIAKGAGMIAPQMATLLAFIFTDACITKRALARSLKLSVEDSFNCISVDGCMSTNDMVAVLANGAGKNALIDLGSIGLFTKALKTVCLELARLIVRDAEGATKFIRIKVDKARDFGEARHIALNIANSNLFKAAMYGQDPNFGRIVASAGASGIAIQEKDIKIKVSPLEKRDISVNVSIGRGNASAVVYTSDLTPGYIRINADYN